MQELKEKLRQAQQNFDYANENYLDAAIMDLNAAEERFRAMIREKKRTYPPPNEIGSRKKYLYISIPRKGRNIQDERNRK